MAGAKTENDEHLEVPKALHFDQQFGAVWVCAKNGANHHDGLSVGRGLTALLHLPPPLN